MIGLKQIHVFQHRRRVLGAESDHVNHGWIKQIFCHCLRIIRVSHKDISLPQAVRKPVGIKGRDIGTLSCLDDHKFCLPSVCLKPNGSRRLFQWIYFLYVFLCNHVKPIDLVGK